MFATRMIIVRSSAKVIQSLIAPRLVGSSASRSVRSSAIRDDPSALSTDSDRGMGLKNRLSGLGMLPFMQDVSYPAPVRAVNESLMQIQSDLDSIARHFITNSDPTAMNMNFNPFVALMGTSSDEDETTPSSALLASLRLPLDIEETETSYNLIASVPGFTMEDVSVTFCPDTHLLTMAGTQGSRGSQGSDDKGTQIKGKEEPVRRATQAAFTRAIRLPARVEASQIKATVKHGLLTVAIPKPPPPEPAKTMKIKIEGPPATA